MVVPPGIEPAYGFGGHLILIKDFVRSTGLVCLWPLGSSESFTGCEVPTQFIIIGKAPMKPAGLAKVNVCKIGSGNPAPPCQILNECH